MSDDLDSDLRELLRREGEKPDFPSARVERALGRLELQLAVGGSRVGGLSRMARRKTVAIAAASLVLGGIGGALVTRSVPVHPPVAHGGPSASSVSAASPVMPEPPVIELVPTVSAPRQRVARVDAGAVPNSGTLGRERAILDEARSALRDGDGPRARGLLMRHETMFPHGILAEEREAIAVRVLVACDERDAAAVRAAEFHQRFPESPLAASVDSSLREP